MSPKNLNASNKTHKFLLNQLKDKQTSKIYKKFEKNLKLNEDFIVAVSGGPDSLALCFLSKIYSIKKHIKVKYFHVDHKLRNNSTKEAKFVKLLLKKLSTNLEILTWVGKKPKSNIQSIARDKRYALMINKAKKLKINNILLGHHKDDLIENFFIRILRGSGLNGLVSFDQTTENFIKNLESEGLDNDKFNLTIKNLKFANQSIKYFVEKNLKDNSTISNINKFVILNKNFFLQPEEVVFRSLTEVLKSVGKKYYPVRGKKIDKLIYQIINDTSFKTTLGNCVIKKVNNSVIVSKER